MKILDKEVCEGDIVLVDGGSKSGSVGFVRDKKNCNFLIKILCKLIGSDLILSDDNSFMGSVIVKNFKSVEVLKKFVKEEVNSEFEQEADEVEKLVKETEEQIEAESKGKDVSATSGTSETVDKSDDKSEKEVK